ncbi:DUF2336 domain-containing protein [Stappia sp. F7233]|uniref:DUF2336 domain-containing protein n=1 Tax=Stappia albiluteola TaxID=2758565 RepID=A0A839AIT4_9HYPH|nr:DUF2336 domain-containing protein [Stappia albiluteola]MBA5779045.1 DUF2336 domain-containing protein [Stappia albiluteola]
MREAEGAARAKVLLAAAELYASRPAHDRAERGIFAELARQMLPETGVESRRRIAELLAGATDAPAETLSQLCRDPDPLVAGPILAEAAALSECDLIQAVGRGPEPLRMAVADRDDLTDAVVTALFAQADAETLRHLVERLEDGAIPCLAGNAEVIPAEALAALETRPELLSALAAELSAIRALPASLLFNLFLELDHQGRMEAIAAAQARALAELARSANAQPLHAFFKPAVLDALVSAALSGGSAAFASHLAYVLALPAETAARIADDNTGEALVICLRALGVNDGDVARILVRLLGVRLTLDELRGLLALHEQISARAAILLVTSWNGGALPEVGKREEAAMHDTVYSGAARIGTELRTAPRSQREESLSPLRRGAG